MSPNPLPNGTPLPVTTLLSTFIATTDPSTALPPPILSKIKQVLLDYIGVVIGGSHGTDSASPIYDSILSLQGGPLPPSPLTSASSSGSYRRHLCTAIGKGPPHMLPQYAGLVNAAWGHSLDFDDTFEKGTLHAGVNVLSAALAALEVILQERGGEEERVLRERFVHAVCVGYEVTCRLGRELGYEAYDRGFHNTGTAGVFGAVATISSLRGLDAETVEMAIGLAGSRAAGSMQYLDNGSWNKRLHPGFAVHDAFVCVALAEKGVVGASRAIEGENGFLQAYSPSQDVDLGRLVEGLGDEWIWMGSSLKPYPACRMTHGFIELAGEVCDEFRKREGREVRAEDIEGLTLSMSHANFLLVGTPAANKVHPENMIDAQFSAYFQTANALLCGSKTGLDAYKKLGDPEIRAMCSKIGVKMDDSIPKGFPAYIQIVWKDGRVEDRFQEFPLGEIQHPFTQDRVNEKFMSLIVPARGQAHATKILQTVEDLENRSIESLLEVLR